MDNTPTPASDVAIAHIIAARDAIHSGQISKTIFLIDTALMLLKKTDAQAIDNCVVKLIEANNGL